MHRPQTARTSTLGDVALKHVTMAELDQFGRTDFRISGNREMSMR
ncbi:hypothetical protein NSS94_25740 [Paenibacillus sp. FSL L8-0644]